MRKLQQKEKQQLTTAYNTLKNMTNDDIIKDYFETLQTEINPSINYVKTIQNSLDVLLYFHNNKPLTEITRQDIISFLNSLKKSEEMDPLHKWIGTYNSRLRNFLSFFKWLYNPKLASKQ